MGASRKSFLGLLVDRPAPERVAATLATTAAAFQEGVELIRVHDVAESRDVLSVLAAVAHACVQRVIEPLVKSVARKGGTWKGSVSFTLGG